MAVQKRIFILVLTLSCSFFSNPCYSETDTLRQGRELKDWDILISSNTVFTLKFFSFGSSTSPYVGIFYNNGRITGYPNRYDYCDEKAVWVANRDNPIPDTSGKLLINGYGRLSITYSGGTIVDLFKPAAPVKINASATLLDSGNFVLNELYPDGSVKRVLWQSFDYPTDTLLRGMKLGINLTTGHQWSLTSWASDSLPATGSVKLTGDPNGSSQLVMLSRGNIFWMSGQWRDGQFENTDLPSSGPDVRLYYTTDEAGEYFTYLTKTYDTSPALTIHPNAYLEGTTLNLNVFCIRRSRRHRQPDRGCIEYKNENSECRATDDWSSQEQVETYGDGYEYDKSYNLTLEDCWKICWNNCSCTAYTYTSENRTGCKVYSQIKSRLVQGDKADKKATMVYFIPLRYLYNEDAGKKHRRWWIWLIIGMGLIALSLCYVVGKTLHVGAKEIKRMILHVTREIGNTAKSLLHVMREIGDTASVLLHDLRENHATAHSTQYREERKMKSELHFFTFQSISAATNNFSSINKLGEGGYGAVYKGKLLDGLEVAVKRLSRSSRQGVQEFMNETQLIAKLQHTNLVRLLGCCIQKEEKILVYEYMMNNSLDFFLFDPSKKELLKWRNRFAIIEGIAQGLLYLHKYSRLRVIHRDLKASNILLDDCLNPKISDFGMAKLFGSNESEATTKRVVGTPGYMSPEYMREGIISTKTDVFSFGVLILEIISDKKNLGTYDVEHPLNLTGLAWELWKEGKGLELMDPVMEDSYFYEEVMTCIHVGLLCVQDRATDRPSMSEVVSMLTNISMQLPDPKRPAFFIQRHEVEVAELEKLRNGSINRQTISIVVPR